MKIFWSWQSDTHQPSGRHFVCDVLRRLCEELAQAPEVEPAERPEVDHDTLDVAGSPPIAETILRKIREAAVFVADVTPVAKTKGGKHVANPNVMIELGYALVVLGHQRIVLVMNASEGAALRHLPFDLRHWRKPIEYALGRDATDERREEVAREFMNALRKSIVPSLKVAAVVEREKQRRLERAPELSVVFQTDGQQRTLVKITQQTVTLDANTIEEVRRNTPLLALPSANRPRLSGVSTRSLSAFGATVPPSQWEPEDIEGYNRFVEHYHREWEEYLGQLTEWALAVQRTFGVHVMLVNAGTAPATNIDVEIGFPPGVILFDNDQLPPKPEAPEPPPLVPLGPGKGFGRPIAQKLDFPSPMERYPRSTIVYSDENIVRFQTADLKHGHQAEIATFRAGFTGREDIAPFAVTYIITANEPIDPITGELLFEVELDGIVVSGSLDEAAN